MGGIDLIRFPGPDDKDSRTLWLWGGMHKQRKAQITRNKFRRRHRWRGNALENFNWRNAAGEIKPTSEGSGKKSFWQRVSQDGRWFWFDAFAIILLHISTHI